MKLFSKYHQNYMTSVHQRHGQTDGQTIYRTVTHRHRAVKTLLFKMIDSFN